MRQLVLRHPGRAHVMPVQHLSATEIAAFIDSTLSPQARAAAELHLTGCARCREELAACSRLANAAPSRVSRPVSWPLLGSIAAAILLVAVLRPPRWRQSGQPAHERAEPATTAGLLAIAPRNGQSIHRQSLRLVWRRDAGAVSYHVVITDSTGTPAWTSGDLGDTAVSPPATAPLRPAVPYYWRVDVLHADGSTSQSATSAFRIAP